MEKIQKQYVNLISENNLESEKKQMEIRDKYYGYQKEQMLKEESRSARGRTKELWSKYQTISSANQNA